MWSATTEWIVEGTTDTNRAKQFLAKGVIFITKAPNGTMVFKKASSSPDSVGFKKPNIELPIAELSGP